jgi:hypothetical protein
VRGAVPRKARSPAGFAAGLLKITGNDYFGGVVEDDSLFSPLFSVFLWCFFLWVALVSFASELDDEEAAGAGAGAGVDWANAGPAIRANAMTGMSFLNIDVVSRRIL